MSGKSPDNYYIQDTSEAAIDLPHSLKHVYFTQPGLNPCWFLWICDLPIGKTLASLNWAMWYHNKHILKIPSKIESQPLSSQPASDYLLIQESPWAYKAWEASFSLSTSITAGVQQWDPQFPLQHPTSLSSQLFGVIPVVGLWPWPPTFHWMQGKTLHFHSVENNFCEMMTIPGLYGGHLVTHYQVVKSSATTLAWLAGAMPKSVFVSWYHI